MISIGDLFPAGLAGEDSEALFQHGDVGRFEDLLNWRDMEEILQRRCFDGPASGAIAAALGLESGPSRVCVITQGKRIWRVPRRIDAKEFLSRLPGSTLRIEAVEEVHPPVRSLAEQLRRHAPMAYCNAYAAWGSSPGLGIHYDYTNIVVLQLEGRKHWKVYRPTRKAVRGPESTAYKETLQQAERGESGDVAELHRVYEGLYWEGMLERGDTLFLPSGWFHAALPAGDPTLHLSCAFNAPVGAGDDAPSIRLPYALRELQSLPEQRRDTVS